MHLLHVVQLAGVFLGALVASTSGQSVTEIACNPATQPAVLTNYADSFATPNFPSNYAENTVCKWLIVSQIPGGWVNLDFNNFYTEATFDLVMVYDGDNENAPILGGFEGTYDPPAYGVLSTQQHMLVTFVSDAFTNRLGFNATYTSVAPFEVIDACVPASRPLFITNYSGTITTTNYPGNYWNYQTCQWVIEAQDVTGTVMLKFNRFFTETNGDFVYLYDGENTAAPLMARISGPRDQPVTYQSTSMYLTVVFSSNSLLSRYGFTADYTTVPPVRN